MAGAACAAVAHSSLDGAESQDLDLGAMALICLGVIRVSLWGLGLESWAGKALERRGRRQRRAVRWVRILVVAWFEMVKRVGFARLGIL